MLTLVFPTALKTRQETGSVKKEWSALVVNTLSLAPCSTTPPLAHLGFKHTTLKCPHNTYVHLYVTQKETPKIETSCFSDMLYMDLHFLFDARLR